MAGLPLLFVSQVLLMRGCQVCSNIVRHVGTIINVYWDC